MTTASAQVATRAKNASGSAIGNSGETVITNSFHGTYWALLLKRKVVCIPFSSKFYGFRYPPAYCTDGDWRKAARQASVRPDALEDARHHNLKFYKLARTALADVGL